ARLQSWLTSTNALALVSQRLGHDISGHPLDGPVPDFPAKTERGQAFSKTLLEMARREKMTLRDLYNITAAARGHWVIAGTPTHIADTMEEWFVSGLADGFVVMPAYFPGAFDDFVDRVVPELQRRGLYRKEYAGTTLRSHLGLERPGVMRRQAAAERICHATSVKLRRHAHRLTPVGRLRFARRWCRASKSLRQSKAWMAGTSPAM